MERDQTLSGAQPGDPENRLKNNLHGGGKIIGKIPVPPSSGIPVSDGKEINSGEFRLQQRRIPGDSRHNTDIGCTPGKNVPQKTLSPGSPVEKRSAVDPYCNHTIPLYQFNEMIVSPRLPAVMHFLIR